jgi:hypothetical protein
MNPGAQKQNSTPTREEEKNGQYEWYREGSVGFERNKKRRDEDRIGKERDYSGNITGEEESLEQVMEDIKPNVPEKSQRIFG